MGGIDSSFIVKVIKLATLSISSVSNSSIHNLKALLRAGWLPSLLNNSALLGSLFSIDVICFINAQSSKIS
ncbi:hypothetical protein JCM19274_5026 [Algibacter lectus]|uniref:Uncharacterized protein n=1 Tax=Algibacter lectus TaxID=221126 RepID=A0A090WM72_9FLAO|nr:hypothetical protein JCM19274_5026 [Algibacter lectus]